MSRDSQKGKMDPDGIQLVFYLLKAVRECVCVDIGGKSWVVPEMRPTVNGEQHECVCVCVHSK